MGVFLWARYRCMAVKCSDISWHLNPNNYRGTALMRNSAPIGPYSRTMLWSLRGS